jgi:UDP-N-acetylmuramate dehydrogenase
LLADHTSFRIGGPAEWFAQPSTVDEVAALLREAALRGLPVSVIGGGTNTLAADRGVRGLVMHLGHAFRSLAPIESPDASFARVRCGAGLLTQRLVVVGAREGWRDVEGLAGLPGQIGGALIMNAQDIGRFVEEVTVVSSDGQVHRIGREALRFGYRTSLLPSGIVVDALFQFARIARAEAALAVQAVFDRRNTTQELRLPSAGCAFRNPTLMPAGRMIDELGLKGARIGDAQVSKRHANFIVNLGRATSCDVLSLMEYIQRQVDRRFGLVLEPEVRVLGESWGA